MAEAARADPAVLERLRERIRTLQAAPRQLLSVLRTGLPPVDGLLPGGGFPLGQVVELWGEPASGRARLAFRAIAEAHRALRLAAWVDGPRTLYAPALPPVPYLNVRSGVCHEADEGRRPPGNAGVPGLAADGGPFGRPGAGSAR